MKAKDKRARSNAGSTSRVPPHGGNRSRSRKFKILSLAFGILLFVTLDLVLASFVIQDQQKSFRKPDSFFHHGLRANQNRLTHWGGHRYRMITNSLGMRDSATGEVPLESDTPRVVLIGDSMIEGLGVDYEDSVAGQLRQRWQPRGVDVLNAGVVSYSPHLYSLKTRYLVDHVGLQFDQLIVFIDISDIQDETFYEGFEPHQDQTNPLFQWWRGHSLMWRVADLLSSPTPRFTNQFRTDAEVNVWMETTEAYHGEVDPEIGRWQWTIDDSLYELWGKRGLALARTHMLELSQLCRDHQIELTVVIYPSPTQIFANDEESIQRRFWQQFCDEVDVTLIDLFPTFIDHSYSGPAEIYQRFYFPSDTHWNKAGHYLVADRVDAAIGARVSK